MTSQMIVRVDADLKKRVARLAKTEGKNVSQVVRSLLEEYVRERDISAYIDDLWERIGTRLKTRGRSRKDIRRAIRQVRSKT